MRNIFENDTEYEHDNVEGSEERINKKDIQMFSMGS